MADAITDWQDMPTPASNITDWQDFPAPPESQFYHNLGKDTELSNFPNVKEDPGYIPTKTTYNPDGTKDSTRQDWMIPLRHMATGIGDLYNQAETKSTDTTPEAVNAMIGLSALPSVARAGSGILGNAGENAAASLARPSGDFPKAAVPLPVKPELYQAAMNQSYEQAKASRPPFYNFMNQAAQGQTIDPSKTVSAAKNIISDIKSDPYHPARPILGRMNDFVDMYDGKTEMPLADAVEMRQDINSYFNPKKFDQGSKSPYFQIGNSLDTQIDKAAKINPIFGKAKTLADQNHVNNVVLPFTENKLLEPFWKPQDYYAQKSVDNGLAKFLPDETRQRASQMFSNIKTPEELDAVTTTLSPDLAASFRQGVADNILNGGGATRLQSAAHTLGSAFNLAPLDTAKNALKTIVGQSFSPKEKALLAATKQPSPTLDSTFGQQLQGLKSIPKPQPLQLTFRNPLGYHEIPTPSNSTEMIQGHGVRPTELTPEQLAANNSGRVERANMGIYPAQGIANAENIAPAQAAAVQGQSQMLGQYGSAPLQDMPPLPEQSSAGMMGTAKIIRGQKSAAARKTKEVGEAVSQFQQNMPIQPEEVQNSAASAKDVKTIQNQSVFPPNTAIMDAFLSAFGKGKQ